MPDAHLEALRRAGLWGLAGPERFGGSQAPAAVVREVHETLAGACGVTFFVWAQHHTPVRMLAAGPAAPAERHLADLCAGHRRAGVAFAYLRRALDTGGATGVHARRVAGGFRVDGEAPWVTGWGLAELFLVGALAGDEVLWFCLEPERHRSRLRASAPLPLSAMSASATVRLAFDGPVVPDDDVVLVETVEEWRRRDRLATAQPNPAVFGVAATACRLLGDAGAALDDERRRCRELSYRLADEQRSDDEALDAMVRARAWSLDVALRASAALVVASGGGAIGLDHPGQRLLREAAFFSIQAQTPPLRAALLDRLQPPAS